MTNEVPKTNAVEQIRSPEPQEMPTEPQPTRQTTTQAATPTVENAADHAVEKIDLETNDLKTENAPQNNEQSGHFKWYLLGGVALGGGIAALASSGNGSSHNGENNQQSDKPDVTPIPPIQTINPSKPVDSFKPNTLPTPSKPESTVKPQEPPTPNPSPVPQPDVENPNNEKSPSNNDTTPLDSNTAVKPESVSVKTYQYHDDIFKRDSDNDGLFDALDPDAAKWNVSERDLRTFTTLSYKDKKDLKAIFEQKNIDAWQTINGNKKDGLNHAFSEKESQDFIQDWDLLAFQDTDEKTGSGLDYSVFGQGKKEDGSYQEIIFAFRGSKEQSSLKDFKQSATAIFKNLPTQAQELEVQAVSIIEKYNPASVYATGHSLGGYLTQYFTGYVMQKNPAFQVKMKHSAIFNPLLLLADKDSDPSLITARENTDQFVKEIIANSDISGVNPLYKSNSYVINGEFLADGISKLKSAGAGAGLLGLLSLFTPFGLLGATITGAAAGLIVGEKFSNFGTYENAIRFEPNKKHDFDGHSMIRFYEKTDDLANHFSFGSRHDNWQNGENVYARDSDHDGIADSVERYFHTDPHDAKSTLAQAKLVINGEQTEQSVPVVLYRFDERQENHKSLSDADVEHLYGNSLDNRIDGGSGTNVLFGGEGRDIFVLGNNQFKQQEINIIGDFNAKEDKLDLRALGLNGNVERLFSHEPHADSPLSWNGETQTLQYHENNQAFTLAEFLNKTELTAENLIV